MIKVGPNEINPTHVFSLSDGDKTLGFLTCNRRGEISLSDGWRQSPMPRTAMKMSQGQAKYEDFELPFTSIIQDNFEGGMNAEDFEDDRTRYRDGRHCDTTRGDILCGPEEKGVELIEQKTEGSLDGAYPEEVWMPKSKSDKVATKYIAQQNITVHSIRSIAVYYQEWGVGTQHVEIWSDDAGFPNVLLGSGQKSVTSEGSVDVKLSNPVSLTLGNTYWIGAYTSCPIGGDIYTAYYVIKDDDGSVAQWFVQNSEWIIVEPRGGVYVSIAFILDGRTPPDVLLFFEHRRSVYLLCSYDGSSSVFLFINGFRGCAKANTGDLSKLNTDADLSKDMYGNPLNLAGKIALIIEGPGVLEEKPWRTIVSNTTTGANDVITVDEPWKIEHTIATSWVVLGTDDWFEITGHGLTSKVTDVCIVYDHVLIAQGTDKNIRKFLWSNNSGTSTNSFKDDGTNRADKLLMVADTEGKMKLWKAMVNDNIVDWANAKYYDTNHTFEGKNIRIGTSKHSDIKQLIAYGDPLIPYVIKEDSFGSIQNDIYAEIPIGELKSVRSEYNGTAAMMHGVYLYFNMGERIERFYDRRLDDVGPDRGEGMVQGRQGIIRKLLPYPGKFYALLYTEGNTPSIVCFNGAGYNEVWRPTNVSEKLGVVEGDEEPFYYDVLNETGGWCTDMIVQVIPGDASDRLWFDYNGEIRFVPVTINPRKDPKYRYRTLSQIETAWNYGNLKDVDKYWHSVKLHTENLISDDVNDIMRLIKVEYKVDEETTWHEVGIANTSPIHELILSPDYDVTGYRIKFRLTLATNTSYISPRLLALVVKGVIRVEVKKGWNVTCVSENELDLNGDEDESGNLLEQLDMWANSVHTPTPLKLRHNIGYYDDKRVFIDPASVALQQVYLVKETGTAERDYKELISFTMYEA